MSAYISDVREIGKKNNLEKSNSAIRRSQRATMAALNWRVELMAP